MSIESNKMTHVEVLQILRGGYDNDPAHAALTAAIAALEAVGKVQKILDGYYGNNTPDVGMTVYEIRKIIPADAVGGG